MLIQEAMSVNQTHADAWTLIGNLHMSKCEWAPAQKKFEYILKLNDYHNDAYSLVALGNVWLETLSSVHRKREKDKDYRERALMMYSKALKVHPKNIWAANGIGCIIAQKGAIQEARDIFAQVREATAEFCDVWVNIAHIYMEQKQYVAAIQMYDNCVKKFKRFNDVPLMQYMARAYYKAGKLDECRFMLEKAQIESPDNLMVKFNYAFVLQKLATQTLRDEKSSLEMVNGAVSDLKTAESIFTYISDNRDETMSQARLVSRSTSANEARCCSDLLKQAQTYVQRAKAQDEEEQRQRQRQEDERLALRRQQEIEAKEREEKTRRELEALKQLRQDFVQKTKDFLRLPTIVEEKRSRSGGGGGRRRRDRDGGEDFVNDSSDMGDWVNEDGTGEPKKKTTERKRARKRRDHSDGNESGNDESGRKERRRKKRARDERRADEFELSAKQKAKVKSREFVASSEDSSSDDANNKPSTAAMARADSDNDEENDTRRKRFSGSDSSDAGDGDKSRIRAHSSSEHETDMEHEGEAPEVNNSLSESDEDRALPSSDDNDSDRQDNQHTSAAGKSNKKRIVSSEDDDPQSDSD
ncbi:unnamed protein product [Anisakis simplex]|uniref:Uncharacterized protein n=1 Tax=Anisakis simplex TaxID=6269 RepID=A0A3P6PC35_ANISI|nr:unnamed protein product [Anisakis simplex]